MGPPFPGAMGSWVLREDFTGNKSFGFFTCPPCQKDWLSAHSFPDYHQQCKACKYRARPTFLWENDENDIDRDRKEEDAEKPHLSHLCQACKLGVCKRFVY